MPFPLEPGWIFLRALSVFLKEVDCIVDALLSSQPHNEPTRFGFCIDHEFWPVREYLVAMKTPESAGQIGEIVLIGDLGELEKGFSAWRVTGLIAANRGNCRLQRFHGKSLLRHPHRLPEGDNRRACRLALFASCHVDTIARHIMEDQGIAGNNMICYKCFENHHEAKDR